MDRHSPVPDYIDLTGEAEAAAVSERMRQMDDGDDAARPREQASRARDGHGHSRSMVAYTVHGIRFRTNDCFETNQPIDEWGSQFVEIKHILVGGARDEVMLRGLPYIRNGALKGPLEAKLNEVCQIIDVVRNDGRPAEEQALVDVRPHAGMIKRCLNKTNMDFTATPNGRYGNRPTYSQRPVEEKLAHGALTCRWRLRMEHQDARRKARPSGGTLRAYGGSFVHLSESDVPDADYRVSDQDRRQKWLGRAPEWEEGRRLTLADIFCGCGGASSGGRQAGLRIQLALDHCPQACRAYELNHRGVVVLEAGVDIISRPDAVLGAVRGVIDIMHLSPPCQPHSPAHTRAGRNDEANQAVILGCGEWVKHLRPRVVTVEQTFGILHDANIQYFYGLVKQLTCLGYSVQWVYRLPCIDYGLPQDRKRLVMVASCPGEELPPWPAATHGPGRYMSEARALEGIAPHPTMHNVQAARLRVPVTARNPHQPLPRTITTGGAQSTPHYRGDRAFTPRELASLQSFPPTYRFEEGATLTTIRRQIGNAYPPCVARAFFQAIRTHLERVDRRRRAAPHGARPRAPSAPLRLRRGQALAGPVPHPPPAAAGQPYGSLNGDLDDDEALERAIRRSRRAHVRPRVIEIQDSDEELIRPMERLSVEPFLPRPPHRAAPRAPSSPGPQQRNDERPRPFPMAGLPLQRNTPPPSRPDRRAPSTPCPPGSDHRAENPAPATIAGSAPAQRTPLAPRPLHRASSTASSTTLANSTSPSRSRSRSRSPSPSPTRCAAKRKHDGPATAGKRARVEDEADLAAREERLRAWEARLRAREEALGPPRQAPEADADADADVEAQWKEAGPVPFRGAPAAARRRSTDRLPAATDEDDAWAF